MPPALPTLPALPASLRATPQCAPPPILDIVPSDPPPTPSVPSSACMFCIVSTTMVVTTSCLRFNPFNTLAAVPSVPALALPLTDDEEEEDEG